MTGRTIVITGGSDGIGAAAARQVAGKGHRIILVGRSAQKTAAVAREIAAEHFVADFAKLDDVHRLAADIRGATDRIDVLANNAGGVFGDRTVTVDHHEKTLQVNLLAPFLLTHLLLDLLQRGDGVVINTSSSSAWMIGKINIDDLEHEKSYSAMQAYGDAKLADILFTRGLNAHYAPKGIRAVAFHPGHVRTNLTSETNHRISRLIYQTPLARLFLISAEKGGSNLAHFIEGTPGRDWEPDRFYSNTAPATPRQTNPQIGDDALVEALWQRCSALVGLAVA